MKKPLLYNIVIFAFLLTAQPVMAKSGAVVFGHSRIVIDTANGRQAYNVEIAANKEQLKQGLMYRAKMAENEGMLFIFPKEQAVIMWMKNTLIPLDMLFIDKGGKVIYIKHDATPGSLEHISAGSMPVRAVLELKGGIADKNNINIGDKVTHKVFAQ